VFCVKRKPSLLSRCLFLLTFLLAGCTPSGFPSIDLAQQRTPFFRPPTEANAVATQSHIQGTIPTNSAPANGQAAPTALCKDNLAFVKDLTIPDGTVVEPLSTLDKRWQVENNGNCNWGENYRVRLIAGPELEAQKEQALYPARSGSQATIRIVFKAPQEPGTYRSAWQAFNAQGTPFGDPFFIEISVTAP
jgi:Ig-like domain from next to BRCA1 gene